MALVYQCGYITSRTKSARFHSTKRRSMAMDLKKDLIYDESTPPHS